MSRALTFLQTVQFRSVPRRHRLACSPELCPTANGTAPAVSASSYFRLACRRL
jgi:hypothetical protein